MAMGLNAEQAESSIRIGIGKYTTSAEINEAAKLIVSAVEECRYDIA
jgi:cysteine sulfinate desulfinase/cysteine desulfurase-like protein